jgi:hypothetical protein
MSWNSRSRLNFSHAINKFTHTHIHTEVITVFPSPSGRTPWPVELLLEAPGHGLSSPSIQWEGTWLKTDFPGMVLSKSRRDCQMSWSISPWSPSWVKTAQRVGLPGQRRTQNTIAVPCPSPLWCSPTFSWSLKRPVGWYLIGASICCGNIVRWETKQHLEEWRTQILYFMPVGSDMYLCLSTEQRIYRIFKRQFRASGYKECALPSIRGW